MKTVIVGGVAAGASTGARLRRLDESAEIVVLERDHYVSFANCGLPYHIGGEIPERDSLLLQTPESLAKSLALDVRTGHEVVRIDREAKEVDVHDLAQERTYRESYDTLVLCLGAEPIRPPIPGADDPRVHVLRNIPDMDRIIDRLEKGLARTPSSSAAATSVSSSPRPSGREDFTPPSSSGRSASCHGSTRR
jgi:NADPH-dependent 2,4-dienoyl-CoA reductase/sulfur reductase-like enzyme